MVLREPNEFEARAKKDLKRHLEALRHRSGQLGPKQISALMRVRYQGSDMEYEQALQDMADEYGLAVVPVAWRELLDRVADQNS